VVRPWYARGTPVVRPWYAVVVRRWYAGGGTPSGTPVCVYLIYIFRFVYLGLFFVTVTFVTFGKKFFQGFHQVNSPLKKSFAQQNQGLNAQGHPEAFAEALGRCDYLRPR